MNTCCIPRALLQSRPEGWTGLCVGQLESNPLAQIRRRPMAHWGWDGLFRWDLSEASLKHPVPVDLGKCVGF